MPFFRPSRCSVTPPRPSLANGLGFRRAAGMLGFALGALLVLLSGSLAAATGRYRLTWREDPASTMVIGFEHQSGSAVRVVYGEEDGGRNPAAYRYTAAPSRTINHAGMRNVFVRLGSLRPGTVYYFLVVDNEGVSNRMMFETPHATPDKPLSIIVGSDSRNNREVARAANRLVGKIRPHFVMFGGDMTASDTASEWQAWFDDWQLTISSDGRLTPIVPARGNHERANESIYNLFDVSNPNIYYTLDFAGGLLRTYTLNTLFPAGGDQLSWLENDLARCKTMWKIAQYHHAMRPHTSTKPERDELITLWATRFSRYGVDLACESDAHTVKQTWPIRPSREPGSAEGFIRDDRQGTVYVGEGCWGAPLRPNDDDKPWTRASGRFNQFKWVWVDLRNIQVRTVMIDRSTGAKEENTNANRFRSPPGIFYWEADNGGDVLIIPRRPTVSPAAPPQGPTMTGGRTTPIIQSTAQLPVLTRDANNRIRVAFQMPGAGVPYLTIQDENLNVLWRKELSVRGPGPYAEFVQLPALPRVGRMEMIVRGADRIVAKYEIR
ncbi:metallophosphoesterase [Neolewinella lacunae]|uniref:Metallophosphoesterase family protein n=1 Tax=Neolewinella lacunae TaxID=1517758 RepID=A0A923PLY9_9BACT|nr:metallophosphoesterase [Neolewinella lacunae]MBC6995864.1 metallophosphoesterase family protein [Neolewinella lacunae]MDN3636443.1 metallophosphoesterase [Neolewinella lacunae]